MADKYFTDHLPFRVRGEIPRGQRRAALFPPVARAIEREGPLRTFGGRKPVSEWMPAVMDVLLEAYAELELDRSRPAHRRQLDALGHIQAVAASLVAIPHELDETCSGSEAIRMLLVELRNETLPPEPGRDAVELVDWLELPLDGHTDRHTHGVQRGLLARVRQWARILARRTSDSPRPPRQSKQTGT